MEMADKKMGTVYHYFHHMVHSEMESGGDVSRSGKELNQVGCSERCFGGHLNQVVVEVSHQQTTFTEQI